MQHSSFARRILLVVALSLLVCLVMAACRSSVSVPVSAAPVESDYLVHVEGSVVASDGSPVPQAEVRVAFDGAVYRGASAITEDATLSDPEGLFSFVYLASASHGTPSTIGLTVSHTGYVSASVLVPFQPETSHRVTLTPTRPETH